MKSMAKEVMFRMYIMFNTLYLLHIYFMLFVILQKMFQHLINVTLTFIPHCGNLPPDQLNYEKEWSTLNGEADC